MKFGHDVPAPAPMPSGEAREKPTRLGGLYNNKSGKGISGSVYVGPGRAGYAPIGPQLIDMINRAMAENRPLRFMVFENDGRFPSKSPYSLHVSLGYPSPSSGAPGGYPPPRGGYEAPRSGYTTGAPVVEDDSDEESGDPGYAEDPAPLPAIRRRLAPRRT